MVDDMMHVKLIVKGIAPLLKKFLDKAYPDEDRKATLGGPDSSSRKEELAALSDSPCSSVHDWWCPSDLEEFKSAPQAHGCEHR